MANYLSLPGTSGHYASTPDNAAFAITDLDARLKVAPDDWDTASEQALFVQTNFSGNQIGWYFHLAPNSGDRLYNRWSSDGSFPASTVRNSTAAVPFANGETGWIRLTLDVSGYDLTFYTSTDGSSWTQLGNVLSGAPKAIHNSTAPLTVGMQGNGTSGPLAGKIYEAILLDSIGGSEVAHFNADDFNVGDSNGATAVDVTGKTWTIAGANSIIAADPTPSTSQSSSPLLLGI